MTEKGFVYGGRAAPARSSRLAGRFARRLAAWLGGGVACGALAGVPALPLSEPAPRLDWPAAATRLASDLESLHPGRVASTTTATPIASADCARALDALGKRGQDGEAAMLQGFVAARCGLHDLAIQRLSARSAGDLEDWRLWTLAQSQTQRAKPAEALASLRTLLAEFPGSPLVSRSLLDAARLTAQRGAGAEALELLERAWREPLTAETVRELDVLTWEIAKTQNDRPRRQAAARRLLVDFPLEAARLQVIDALRGPDGVFDWRSFDGASLLARAENLIEARVAGGALQALDAVAASEQGPRWLALRARAMVLDRQGAQALNLLDRAPSGLPKMATPAERAEVAWARALAAEEAMTPARGRRALTAAERAALQTQEHEALWQTAAAADHAPERAEAALRWLAKDFSTSQRYADAVRAMQALRRVAPEDLSGAPYLWTNGWAEYRAGRYAVAIERWRALASLYPESRYTRSGLYWIARATSNLGHKAEGEAALKLLAAADTNDFYRRQALVRLGSAASAAASVVAVPARPRETWPTNPAIDRARLLSDLGLDSAALFELDVETDGAARPARASVALRALILARQGERRESLRLLSTAFPALGSANQADLPPLALELYYPLDYSETIRNLARSQGLPASLVFGIIHQESAFDRKAISHAGARGLMQLMPKTAKEVSRKLRLPYSLARMTDADFSVRLGTSYFRQVLEMFDGRVEVALAGYNAGPTRIRRLWSQSPGEVDAFVDDLSFDETKIYVKRILAISDSYKRLHPELG
jgi:soluble lytic murein transglycosylase-like protein